jgi:hypothetical protein
MINEEMKRIINYLPGSKFYLFNPNSKKYGYKFSEGQLILKELNSEEDLIKLIDISPIKEYLENLCSFQAPIKY